MALPVKALKAGQEAYWLDQIARYREEYFSGRGESPGRFVGTAAAESGLEGAASAEQVRAMFQGLDPATGELRCAPLCADPRSKLAAGPLLGALKPTSPSKAPPSWSNSLAPRRSRAMSARSRRRVGPVGPGG